MILIYTKLDALFLFLTPNYEIFIPLSECVLALPLVSGLRSTSTRSNNYGAAVFYAGYGGFICDARRGCYEYLAMA